MNSGRVPSRHTQHKMTRSRRRYTGASTQRRDALADDLYNIHNINIHRIYTYIHIQIVWLERQTETTKMPVYSMLLQTVNFKQNVDLDCLRVQWNLTNGTWQKWSGYSNRDFGLHCGK